MIEKIILFICLLFTSLKAGTIVNNFNQLPSSSELFGSSGSFYLIRRGPYAVGVNAAGIYTTLKQIYFAHLDYLADIKSENLSGSFYLPKIKLQLSGGFFYRYASDTKFTTIEDNIYKSFKSMNLYSTVLNIGAAYKLNENLYTGILYKKINTRIVDSKYNSSYLDLGIIWDKLLGEFNLGFSIRNILSKKIDKSIGLKIPLSKFFDIILGYDSSISIKGFNVSGFVSLNRFLKVGINYNEQRIRYSGIFLYEDLYEAAVSIQFTDIGAITLLSIGIKI